MIKKLKEILEKHILCEVYTNDVDVDKFAVGYIFAVDDTDCLLCNLDYYGKYDGLTCLLTDDIYEVKTETTYLKCIDKLSGFGTLNLKFEQQKDSVFDSVLNEIYKNCRICAIELFDSGKENITGHLTSINKKASIEIECIDEYGNYDGKVFIDARSISCITYDSLDTRRIEKLIVKE